MSIKIQEPCINGICEMALLMMLNWNSTIVIVLLPKFGRYNDKSGTNPGIRGRIKSLMITVKSISRYVYKTSKDTVIVE